MNTVKYLLGLKHYYCLYLHIRKNTLEAMFIYINHHIIMKASILSNDGTEPIIIKKTEFTKSEVGG